MCTQLESCRVSEAAAGQRVEQLQVEMTSKQQVISQLQDKFLHSSAHIQQETIKY